ncbi:hypothetical protein [Metabacillus sp. 84]|uniref:hypothetical protein n=1 Tax=Metabacillus sp. 84 TaxID=3404705 RepID=UPI003CEB3E43
MEKEAREPSPCFLNPRTVPVLPEPLSLSQSGVHFVDPHYVDSYVRKDGAFVEGYFRDGDGNTAVNQSAEQGGGYMRSNSDGNPFNNLK